MNEYCGRISEQILFLENSDELDIEKVESVLRETGKAHEHYLKELASFNLLYDRLNRTLLEISSKYLVSKYYTTREAMSALAVSRRTLLNYRSSNLIRSKRVNGKIYHLREDVDNFHRNEWTRRRQRMLEKRYERYILLKEK